MYKHVKQEIKVWDVFIRLFHWLLVVAFIFAYVTEDDLMLIHSLSGYLITILLVARIAYGFIGTRYARFTNFIYKPTTALKYVKDVMLFNAPRYIGHNPAGGLMIIIMLISLIMTCFSGMVSLAVEEHTGPLYGYLDVIPRWLMSIMNNMHELLAHFTLLLVATHVAGVLIESIVHQENLIRSMINGRKRGI